MKTERVDIRAPNIETFLQDCQGTIQMLSGINPLLSSLEFSVEFRGTLYLVEVQFPTKEQFQNALQHMSATEDYNTLEQHK